MIDSLLGRSVLEGEDHVQCDKVSNWSRDPGAMELVLGREWGRRVDLLYTHSWGLSERVSLDPSQPP